MRLPPTASVLARESHVLTCIPTRRGYHMISAMRRTLAIVAVLLGLGAAAAAAAQAAPAQAPSLGTAPSHASTHRISPDDWWWGPH